MGSSSCISVSEHRLFKAVMGDLDTVKAAIDEYPDFPKKGILFQDVFGIFRKPEAHSALHNLLVQHAQAHKEEVDVIVGLDARGFLLGPAMALAINKPFVPIRKVGKLPGKCVKESYKLEYGEDTMEVQEGAISTGSRVLIVDDLLATGGTMAAASSLVRRCGGVVAHCWIIVELAALEGRKKVKEEVKALITMEDIH